MRSFFVILVLIGAAFLNMANAQSQDEQFRNLRQMVFNLAHDREFAKYSEDGSPIAVIMESNFGDIIVTLVVIGDGTTSLYFDNGGGIIGAGLHASVRTASTRFLKMIKHYKLLFQMATDQPLPGPQKTLFYIIDKGLILRSAAFDDAEVEISELYPLFVQAQEVVTEIRLATPERQ
jgi:hypothetical protein